MCGTWEAEGFSAAAFVAYSSAKSHYRSIKRQKTNGEERVSKLKLNLAMAGRARHEHMRAVIVLLTVRVLSSNSCL